MTTTGGPVLTGRAVDLDADGRLLIDRQGRLEPVGAGDVEHLRPLV